SSSRWSGRAAVGTLPRADRALRSSLRKLRDHEANKALVALLQLRELSSKESHLPSFTERQGFSAKIQRLDLFWLGFAVIEKLIHRNFERLRVLRKRVERWNSVAVLNARGVAAQHTCAFLDVALREVLRFPDRSQTFSNHQ